MDSNDSLFLEVSDNGGTSWTLLEQFTSISGTSSGTRSYDLTAYIATDTQVRFRVDGLNGTGGTTCCYGGPTENFLVNDFRIEVPTLAACGADHFSIDHDGTAINLGTMERITVIDAVRMVLEFTGHEATVRFLTDMPTGPKNRVADNSLAKNLLGWEPEVLFRQGLKSTIDWYYKTKNRSEVERILQSGGLISRAVHNVA